SASRADRRRPSAIARPGARGRTARSVGPHRAWDSRVLLASRRAGGRLGGRRIPRPQVRPGRGPGGHLGWADFLAVRRHIAAAWSAVADLVDQLVARQPCADRCQVGSALAAAALEGVAVAAVLVLEQGGTLQA